MKADLRLVQAVDVDPDNPETFGRAYEEYFPGIYNYIRYRVGEAAVADDLTSITFHKALDRLPAYDPSRATFSTWLLVIARNVVNDHQRTRRRRQTLLFGWFRERRPAQPDPEAILIGDEERDHLLAAVQALPERERDILSLKFAGGRTNRAIAELVGQSESNVGVIVHRALGKLRNRLGAGEEIR
ncbi:MAG: sigma-70 family RNA polymerase sigma factor [Candidatus Krumholzibacteriota bacterium]